MDAVATHHPPTRAARAWRAIRRRVTLRRVRLTTGLVLFTYVTAHLTNHALGNASFDTMEATLNFLSNIWLDPTVTVILYGSLLTHLGLGLWALYQRRWHSVRTAEIVQLVLGLSIPFILFNHIEGTRISHEIYGTWRGYGQELYVLWVLSPIKGDLQLTLLIIAWIHGCIGLHYWLRLRPITRCCARSCSRPRCCCPRSPCSATSRAAAWSRNSAGSPASRPTTSPKATWAPRRRTRRCGTRT